MLSVRAPRSNFRFISVSPNRIVATSLLVIIGACASGCSATPHPVSPSTLHWLSNTVEAGAQDDGTLVANFPEPSAFTRHHREPLGKNTRVPGSSNHHRTRTL